MLTIPINDLSGVARNSTTTIRIGKGWTYHELQIDYTGMKISDVGAIRVMLNGQPVQRYRSLAELIKMNQYDGVDLEHVLDFTNPDNDAAATTAAIDALPTSGSFTLLFDRQNMRTRVGEQSTAIGTGLPLSENNPFPVNNFIVEIDVKDSATVTTPSLDVYADVSQASPTGWIIKKRTFEFDPKVGDDFHIADLPKFGRINRIFFHESENDAITKAVVETNTNKTFERKLSLFKKQRSRFAKHYGGKSYDDQLVIDPTERGFADEGLAVLTKKGDPVQDFRLILKIAKECHLGVTVEYLSQLGNG